MRNLRAFILILLGVGLAMTLFAPPRYVELAALREQDAQLDSAFTLAEDGDPDALERWLVNQPPVARRSLAAALIRRLDDKTIHSDDRLLYQHRHWLIPFVEVGTGDELVDAAMDNGLAYALSAGTLEHSEQEIVLMRNLVAPLTKAATDYESPLFWDTVGCLHFALGDRKAAVAAFEQAKQLLADADPEDELLMALRRIVSERSTAAMDPEAVLPTVWGHEGHMTIDGTVIEWVTDENIQQATQTVPEEVSQAAPEPAGEAIDASLRTADDHLLRRLVA